jgi:hypothetical protein
MDRLFLLSHQFTKLASIYTKIWCLNNSILHWKFSISIYSVFRWFQVSKRLSFSLTILNVVDFQCPNNSTFHWWFLVSTQLSFLLLNFSVRTTQFFVANFQCPNDSVFHCWFSVSKRLSFSLMIFSVQIWLSNTVINIISCNHQNSSRHNSNLPHFYVWPNKALEKDVSFLLNFLHTIIFMT